VCPEDLSPDMFLRPEQDEAGATNTDPTLQKEPIQDKLTGGFVLTAIGTGMPASRDGHGSSSAALVDVRGIAIDTFPNSPNRGSIYFTDASWNVIRRVSPSGRVHTIAGGKEAGRSPSCSWYDCRDGPRRVARFSGPNGIAITPEGTLYVTDTCNHRIRKISVPGYEVSTYAGHGLMGHRDGALSSAAFHCPRGIAYHPEGYLVVADTGNWRIRAVSLDQGKTSKDKVKSVWTLTGSACRRRTASKLPFGSKNRINCRGYRDGYGPKSKFLNPQEVCVSHKDGSIFVTDRPLTYQNQYPFAHSIRRIQIDRKTGYVNVSTVAGTDRWGRQDGKGSSAHFNQPKGIAIDAEGIAYIADTGNNRIRKMIPDGQVVHILSDSLTQMDDYASSETKYANGNT